MSRVSGSMRGGGSPLKAALGSSSTFGGKQGKELPLLECPNCCVRVVKIKSKQRETYDQVFFKCPNNIRGDSTTCGFIRSEKEYEAFVRGIEEREQGLKHQLYNLEVLDEAECLGEMNEMKHQLGEMKHQLGEMRQLVDRALGEVWTMKMQICELQQKTCEGKKGFDIGFAVVGVVFGIFVTLMWKSSEL
ncbi:unnamed protein product [Urochloa decumbens]|uniref:Uncharacterized protein n=1 Tax=Urochloa decumbens TaxID=240449 RepID=A0ABC9FDS5_9POAL